MRYDHPIRTLAGEPTTLADYKGKVLLIVNTASNCGFTPQYRGLEDLHKRFQERGLVVMGFPCNQFGGQEPGSNEEIAAFCEKNYGVTFPMFDKVEVNGPYAHPLFAELKAQAPGVLGTEAIKWNFTKFLVDKTGKVVKRFAPNDEPKTLADDIEKQL
ncbi:MAG: glutathione peroxidase [Myxococcota bacterium]